MLPNKDGNILPIIEQVFPCITHFTCKILSCIHTFVLHTKGLKVYTYYIPELCFFSREFGRKRGCRLYTTADNRSPSMLIYLSKC